MLSGMKVVEVAYYYPAPYCCKILADLGAEVIKVEPPQGDPMRYKKEIFANLNHNKKIIRLNLKDDGDRERFYEIVKVCDVVIEGFRVGVARKLGIDYQTLKKINPSIIYCSVSGFGQDKKDRPVHDINILSLTGICEITGLKLGKAEDPNVQLSDFASSMFAAISILSAYVRKLKTNKGTFIDLSMFNSALASIPLHVASVANGYSIIEDFVSNPGYAIYEAKDGYVSIGILDEPKFWERFCDLMNLDFGKLSFDERIKREKEIRAKIAEKFKNLKISQIEELFGDSIPYSVVRSLEDVLKDSEILRDVIFEGESFKVIKFPAKFKDGNESK